MFSRSEPLRGAALLALTALIGSGAAMARETAPATATYSYELPANSASLYPDQSWLPAPYKPKYANLADTIKTYTQQSLDADGLKGVTVAVKAASGKATVTLTGADLDTLKQFAKMHQTFLDGNHAVQGLTGVAKCQKTRGCWDPHSNPKQPWAFFLPLGLPMTQQKAVSFLNYPPAASLLAENYLDNFTMKRWSSVLTTVGIDDPVKYETIVDSRPIAAPGSGQAAYMPDIETYFGQYVTPMLTLLANTPAAPAKATLPVIVLGTPAGEAWAKLIKQPKVSALDVGVVKLPGATKPTAWVATNHPDVTAYQCCPGDPNCPTNPAYPSGELVKDEVIDLQAACIIKGLAENPSANPEAVKSSCMKTWTTSGAPEVQKTICVRARLDYSMEAKGKCASPAAAEAFCARHDNNACPAGPQAYSCDDTTGQSHEAKK